MCIRDSVTPEPDKDAETDTPAPKPEKKSNVGMILVLFVLAGAAGAAYYYIKLDVYKRQETDILNNFKTLGVRTEPLSGYERLKVLHDVFNMDTNEPFRFSFDMVARTGLSTKDFIAPTSFDFREGYHLGSNRL